MAGQRPHEPPGDGWVPCHLTIRGVRFLHRTRARPARSREHVRAPRHTHTTTTRHHTREGAAMISWTLTTAAEDDTTTQTGAALDLRTAATELIDATRASIIESAAERRPVYTLTLDGDWLTSIATGETPTGAPDRDLALDRLTDIENELVGRDRVADPN
ncbi:hypothetical protein OPAG_06781 [Rhodococcus opacus PD630]|nr:hypothetical protein OPAG_06781 [Rhodococcus opacus PD630]